MLETPRKPVNEEADGLGQLKTLLFRGEAARLKAVESTVEALDRRVGDAPRLENATAEILVEALRRAEVARHRELAQAIAPVVVAAIQNEIKNSKDMMVEALYPLTGQLVVAAVSNAVRDMMAAMNERLDALTSLERWKLRLRARVTGRPVSELAMSDSGRPRLTRALFLERGSGELLASWRADRMPEEHGELIGGLLAALTGFARDALGDGSGDLRTLDFGGRDIQVRASPTHIIACEFTMPLRAAQKASLDQDCFAWLEQFGRDGVANNKVFGAFIENALARVRPEAKKTLGWPMLFAMGAIALAALGLLTRSALHVWREHALAGALASVVEQRPALGAYPLDIKTNHSTGQIELRGLAPSEADVDALKKGLGAVAASGYEVTTRVGVVATNASLGEEIRAARQQIADLGGKLDTLARSSATASALGETRAEQKSLAALADGLATKLAATEGQVTELTPRVGATATRVADLVARAEAPRARLATLIGGFAVYFNALQPLDAPGQKERLDAIAACLRETGLGLRVIGYADETGTSAKNEQISGQRADLIAEMLFSRGVARDKVITIGRADADPIAPSTPGQRERNRRAVFEIPYEGEVAP